ncbi:MAG: GC-type dockerin domain-anchored protein [Phycisphaerales bacterium JB060]
MRTLVSAAVCFVLVHAALAQSPDPCLSQRFHPDFQDQRLEFGVDVAISDEHLLVADRAGGAKIYTYRKDPATGDWVFNHAVPGGGRGNVALHEDRFITGSGRPERYGGALIYEFDGSRWNEIAELGSPDIAALSPWGENVAIRGGVAAVSNWGTDVLIFRERAGGIWEEVAQIEQPPPGVPRADYGDSIAMDDRFLFIGAPGEDLIPGYSGTQNGAIYVYEWDADGVPVLAQKVTRVPDGMVGPRLGASLAVDGDALLAGAWGHQIDGDTVGAAFVFSFRDGGWDFEQELLSPQPTFADSFGWDVDLLGDILVVGALGDYAGPGEGIGVAHLYRRAPGGPWSHAASVTIQIPAWDYAEAVALSGTQLVVGGSETIVMGQDQGVADVFDLDCLLCAPDLDADGALTIFDFLMFFNMFEDGEAAADFDGDGELTIFDFLAFQTAFDAGCE